MGILSDLKRLLFAKSSVAKSTGKKIVDESKEFAADIREEAAEAWEKAKKAGEKLAEDASERLNTMADKVDVDGTLEKARDFTRRMTTSTESQGPDELISDRKGSSDTGAMDSSETGNISGQGSEWLEKASEKAADFGKKASENFKEASEKIGEKAMDLSDALSQKARELADKIDAKLDETVEKAKKMAEEENRESSSSHADTRHDESELLTRSNLEDKDDFFSKADRFAKGKSLLEKDKSENGDGQRKSNQKAYGFEDLDGDGNEIVDDAILDEEPDN